MSDINLRFQYSPSSNTDIRTFSVCASNDQELYKFYHPVTGLSIGVTTFFRKNPATNIYDTAGSIEWLSNTNAIVHFGIEEVSIRDLRKAKRSNSQSRRFKAGGSEYRWKFGDNNKGDLDCLDSWGKIVASWTQEQLRLRVATRAEDILDRIVVTCLLNLWFRDLGIW